MFHASRHAPHAGRILDTTLRRLLLASLPVVIGAGAPASAATRPNVLFIAVDDLRPQLGCYGAAAVRSPKSPQ